jgi:hypothetical protein
VRIQYHLVPLLSAKAYHGGHLETLFEATRAHKKIEHEDKVIDREAREIKLARRP